MFTNGLVMSLLEQTADALKAIELAFHSFDGDDFRVLVGTSQIGCGNLRWCFWAVEDWLLTVDAGAARTNECRRIGFTEHWRGAWRTWKRTCRAGL